MFPCISLYLIIYIAHWDRAVQILNGKMHIGKLIKQQVEEQGKTVVWFAQQLSYSRTNVYKIYEKSSIDTDVLMRISLVLHYDFFKLYSERLEESFVDSVSD